MKLGMDGFTDLCDFWKIHFYQKWLKMKKKKNTAKKTYLIKTLKNAHRGKLIDYQIKYIIGFYGSRALLMGPPEGKILIIDVVS